MPATPNKKAQKFLMGEQEILSPIKKGIKLDVSKMNMSFNHTDSTDTTKSAKQKKTKPNVNPHTPESNKKTSQQNKRRASQYNLDKSSSSFSSSSSSSSLGLEDSFTNEVENEKNRQDKKNEKQDKGKKNEKAKKNEKGKGANEVEKNKGKKKEEGTVVNKQEETQNKEKVMPSETPKNKRRASVSTENADGEKTPTGTSRKKQKKETNEIIEESPKKKKNVTTSEKEEKEGEKGEMSKLTKKDSKELNKSNTMKKLQSKSAVSSGATTPSVGTKTEKSKKKKNSMEENENKGKDQTEIETKQESSVEGTREISKLSSKAMTAAMKKETIQMKRIDLSQVQIEFIEDNACEYEDGVIYESMILNKKEYSIGENVLIWKDPQIEAYDVRNILACTQKAKISSLFKNACTDRVEAEVCVYFDNTDEAYIRDLEQRQRSRRSKEDFEAFLNEKTKHFHLLGRIDFKIIDVRRIVQKINVFNDQKSFDAFEFGENGKDKFLCLYYLKEREDRICEIQNEDHWDNLVLGSSNLYYLFSNNKKGTKNKSIQLFIEKLKVHEEGKDMGTPRKSPTTTSNKNAQTMKEPKTEKAKAKSTTHKEIKKRESVRTTGKEKHAEEDMDQLMIEEREKYYKDLLSNITNPTDRAIRMMQLDVVPKYLPCREKEIKQVHNFLESGIKQSGSNHILYISGMPGTGKTATVFSVLQLLKAKSKKKILPNFNILQINGMNVVHPNAAYQVFYKQLFNKKPPNALNSYKIIDRLFNRSKKDNRDVSVLIIDEIDYLITKTQKVLFTFFDWPTKINSKLVLIAISNTMDLPDRLIPRCKSRLAFGRLVFSPYKGDEIEKIIKERLENCKDIIDTTAIQLCARKVANVSGDIRKALQICRKAFENKRGNKIVPRDIIEASNQLFDSPLSSAINFLPWAFKMFLTCIIIEHRLINEFIIPFKSVVNRYKTMIQTSGKFIGVGSDNELFKIMLDKLVKMGILLIRPYIPLEDLTKRNKETSLGFIDANKKESKASACSSRTQVSPDIDKESGDMGLELNVEIQLIITALMKDSECSKKLNFY